MIWPVNGEGVNNITIHDSETANYLNKWLEDDKDIKPGYVKLMLTILYRKDELHEKFQDLKNFELLKSLWYKHSTIFDWVCVVLQEVQKGTTLQLLRIDFRSSDLMVRALYSQSRCPRFKITGWLQDLLRLSSFQGQWIEYQELQGACGKK